MSWELAADSSGASWTWASVRTLTPRSWAADSPGSAEPSDPSAVICGARMLPSSSCSVSAPLTAPNSREVSGSNATVPTSTAGWGGVTDRSSSGPSSNSGSGGCTGPGHHICTEPGRELDSPGDPESVSLGGGTDTNSTAASWGTRQASPSRDRASPERPSLVSWPRSSMPRSGGRLASWSSSRSWSWSAIHLLHGAAARTPRDGDQHGQGQRDVQGDLPGQQSWLMPVQLELTGWAGRDGGMIG